MKNTFIKNLSGHSGCTLKLFRAESGNFFVRKSSGKESYNIRLKKQCVKQKKFELIGVKTPKVLGYGKTRGLFYFDMEFIDGITFANFMNSINIKEVNTYTHKLFTAVANVKEKDSLNANEIFHNKIKTLKNNVINIKHFNTESIEKAFNLIENFDYKNIPFSHCCGDLTLENIILARDNIYLIDLLDSFYNSWMIDIAKILQDVDLGWSYRKQKKDIGLSLRLELAKKAIWEDILFYQEGVYKLYEIYIILTLNILRIYPYSDEKVDIDFLNNSLEKIMDELNYLKEKL